MMIEKIIFALAKVKEQNPLIHQITNYVSVNDCANVTLAIGASPVMAQDIEEVAEMVGHAKALVVNIGTLQSQNREAMFVAGRRAKELSIPVIFDPVGVGATRYRTSMAKQFIREIKPDIIRCNMSELKVLCEIETAVKGVDSAAASEGGEQAARQLAGQIGGTVAVTGAVDIITCGSRCVKIANGHLLLTRVTGTGCMTTALVASYAAIGNAFDGAVAGTLSMGIAGELAAAQLKENEGIGTFRVRLLDTIFNLNDGIIKRYAKIIA